MEQQKRYLVLDTNIILLDANNIITLGSEPDVVICIPETVVDELDSKKSLVNELGFQAREFGRLITKGTIQPTLNIEDLVITPVHLESGTVVHITSTTTYPDFSDVSSNILNDRKIIEIAVQYQNIFEKPHNTTFISNDVMCRIRAESLGLAASDFRIVENTEFEFTKTLDLTPEQFGTVHKRGVTEIDPDYKPQNYNYKFTCNLYDQVKLATIQNGTVNVIGKDSEKELRQQDISPINSEQLFLSSCIQDPNIDIVICESLAGSGFN